MTPTQFRDAIAKVGLSQEAAGVWFGRSKRTGQRWASGDYEVPNYVARFLRFMVKAGLTPYDIVNGRRTGGINARIRKLEDAP